MNWFIEKDAITKFFHNVANGCRNRNHIHRISHFDIVYEGDREIGKAFTSLFCSQFGSKQLHRLKINWFRLFASKDHVDLAPLESPFSSDEIRAAVFDLGTNKAPGPDKFLVSFFQKLWDVVGPEVVKLCSDFYIHLVNLENINWANIVLIPKT